MLCRSKNGQNSIIIVQEVGRRSLCTCTSRTLSHANRKRQGLFVSFLTKEQQQGEEHQQQQNREREKHEPQKDKHAFLKHLVGLGKLERNKLIIKEFY